MYAASYIFLQRNSSAFIVFAVRRRYLKMAVGLDNLLVDSLGLIALTDLSFCDSLSLDTAFLLTLLLRCSVAVSFFITPAYFSATTKPA